MNSFKTNSFKWRIDFLTTSLNLATKKLTLSLNQLEGYTESIGFNYIELGKDCQVAYCLQCD